MTIRLFAAPAAMLLALSLGVQPALADGQRRGRQQNSEGRSAPRVSGRQAVPRSDGGWQRQGSQVPSRARNDIRSRYASPDRGFARGNRAYAARPSEPNRSQWNQRSYGGPGRSGPAYSNRNSAVPRQYQSFGPPSSYRSHGSPSYPSRGYSSYRYYGSPRGYGYPYPAYRPYYGVPYGTYWAHPYYSFRPHISIGFGLWLGYPVAYPYYGYAYGSYPGYQYPRPSTYVGVAPGVSTYGGIAFEITPPNAEVYVDGQYAGVAGDFSPNYAPLALEPGAHRIELRAQGYAPIVFDVNVAPGRVLPYRGDMQPY